MLDPDHQKLIERASDMKRAGITHAQIAAETGLDLDYLSVVLRAIRNPRAGRTHDALDAVAVNTIIASYLSGRSVPKIAQDWLLGVSTVYRLTKHVRDRGPRRKPPTKAPSFQQVYEDLDRAILSRLLDGVPRKEIMAEFGISKMKITRVIRRRAGGIPINRVHPREQEILEAYDACGKALRVAMQLGVDRRAVKRAVERRAKFQTAANANEFLRASA